MKPLRFKYIIGILCIVVSSSAPARYMSGEHLSANESILLQLNPIPEASAQSPTHNLEYKSGEHRSAGESIGLKFNGHIIPARSVLLGLSNGLNLTYGQIMTLAGDYFGIPSEPISLASSLEDRKVRFLHAFHSLSKEDSALKESPNILSEIDWEWQQVMNAIEHNESPNKVYERISVDESKFFNCITGGSCNSFSPWIPMGRYLKLAEKNFDHFGRYAKKAYEAGHRVALEKALEAKNKQNPALLKTAYAMNAFACHYLSDLFASGHMRTPRFELYHSVIPSIVGSVLSDYMHAEDNTFGLVVQNKKGQTWMAFGDAYFLDPRNQENREIFIDALQTSANEIFKAYSSGTLPDRDEIDDLIPDLDALEADVESEHPVNSSPLFYWDKKEQVLKLRDDLSDRTVYHHHSNWFGWITLAQLYWKNGRNDYFKILFAHPEYHQDLTYKGLPSS